jgi:hypothetical protein
MFMLFAREIQFHLENPVMNSANTSMKAQAAKKPSVSSLASKILSLGYWQLGLAFLLAWLAFVVGMSFFVSDSTAMQPYAQAFTHQISQYVPMLSSIQRIPGASEWVRLFYAVMWTIAPLFMVFGWLMRRQMCIKKIYLQPISDIRVILSVLGLMLMTAVLLWWPVDDGRGWRDQAAISRGFGVAHFAFCAFVCGAGAGLYARLIYARIKFGNYEEINLERH